jgi:hypothetical protein
MPNTQRVVTLGDGRRVGLGVYVKAWKTVLAAPATAWFRTTPCSWAGGDRAQALREFRAGLDDRINRHIPDYGRGRKWQSQWQIETWRAAQALNHPRLVIHWLPEWLKARFGARLQHDFD